MKRVAVREWLPVRSEAMMFEVPGIPRSAGQIPGSAPKLPVSTAHGNFPQVDDQTHIFGEN
jgi:hypothetical protein